MSEPATDPIIELVDVSRRTEGTQLLERINWQVRAGEHWVVLGPNGSGKSTLLRIAALQLHPTTGTVSVLGRTLGRTDVRLLRRQIGYASANLADAFRPNLAAADVVMTALHGALEPWWHDYDDEDRDRACDLLKKIDCGHRAEHRFGTLSSGERQRVLLARTLMVDPELLLLDEPTAGLDLGGREELVSALADLATDPATPPMVQVTHHVEEIPPGFTHGLLMESGRIVSGGPLTDVLTARALSDCYGLDLSLACEEGRWTVRVKGADR